LGLLAPLLLLAFALSLGYLWNEDFWWYLSSGEAILKNGGIPANDPFLYTSTGTGHWVYHSWLWTVLVALLHRAAGLPGVLVFGSLLVAALVTLVYTTAPVDRYGLVNALLTSGVLIAAHQRLSHKAEVVTWLLLIVFCRVLNREGPLTWRHGALLLGLQVLWANLHGGYPLGIFAAAAYAAGSWIQQRRPWRRQASAASIDDWRILLRLTPLLLLASLLQPSLFRGQIEMLTSLIGTAAARLAGGGGDPLVLEWQPVFPSADLSIRLTWILLAAVGLWSFRAARGRHSWSRLLLFAGLAALAATAIRHVTGLAIATAFVTLANLGERAAEPTAQTAQERRSRRPLRLAYTAGALALGLYLLTAAIGLWLARSDFDNGSDRGSFFAVHPQAAAPGAAEFLLRTHPPGPVFNDFATGGYLTWRLYPAYQVFIDSRILEPRLVSEYKRMLTYPSAWQAAQSRYGFRTAVLGTYSKTIRSPVGEALRRDPRWRLVYLDPQAAVFVRDEGTGTVFTAPDTVPAETERVPFVEPRTAGVAHLARLASRPFFRQDASRYLTEYLATLGSLGKVREAEDLASAALRQSPGHPLLLRQRCAARFARGNAAEAQADCEAAYRLRDDDVGILTLYAMVLDQQGNKTEARRLVDRAREIAPGDPQVANAASLVR
jgi:tetratricopeptide (TPR) repeat protein